MLIINGRVLIFRPSTALTKSDGEFFIPTGYKIQVAPLAAVTAAKTVTVVCLAGDY